MLYLAILFLFVRFSSSETVSVTFDVNYPIIITDKFMNESYFGVTVALGEKRTADAFSGMGWIFIGAPKSDYARDSKPNSENFKSGMNPGVLWRCSLGRPGENDLRDSKSVDNCEIFQLDDNLVTKANGKPLKESKVDNFLGLSLTLDEDRLVTCSPKWVRGGKYMNGMCYWFNKEINSSFASYTGDADAKALIDRSSYEHRLLPFFIEEEGNIKYQFVTLNGSTEGGQDWSTGQAGMSIHIASAGNTKKVLIGAPGVRLWSGAIAMYTDNVNPGKSERTRKNANKRPFFSKYIVFHRGKADTKSTYTDETNWFDYFGYAVTSGKLDSRKEFYVGGSPRGNNLYGEAIVFKYTDDNSKELRMQIKESDIITTLKATEENFGSYFGSVLHTMDIFGDDGVSEIFVGAPLYGINKGRQRRGAPGSPEGLTTSRTEYTGDQGAVFVFQYDLQTETFKQVQRLMGNSISGSRFGTTISSIVKKSGNNQIKQLVIGAAYENCGYTDTSCGAVYIYESAGSATTANMLEKLELKHKLDPSEWNHPQPLRGFGSSLSLGVDIDQNDTPDLAIGAYKSQKVVVLRSRPQLKLRGTIHFFDIRNNRTGISKLSRDSDGIIVESCILSEEFKNLGTIADRLEIVVKLIVDRDFDRFEFVKKQRSVTYNAMIAYANYTDSVSKDKQKCRQFELKFKIKNYLAQDDAKLFDIKVIQELNYVYSSSGMKLRQLDITEGTGGTYHFTTPITRFTDFQAKLPFTTNSKMEFPLAISPTDCELDTCKPIFNFSTNWYYSDDAKRSKPITKYILGSTSDIILEIVITNTGETALKPRFTSAWFYSEVKDFSPECKKELRHATATYNSKRELNCDYKRIPNKLNKTVTLKFDMRYTYARDAADGKYFEVKIAIKQEVDKEHFIQFVKLPLDVEGNAQITGSRDDSVSLSNPFSFKCTNLGFDGNDGTNNNNPKDELIELFSSIQQKFEIHLRGKSAVDTFITTFQIPVKRKGSDKQMILVQRPTKKQLSRGSYIVEECDSLISSLNFFDVERQEKHPMDNDGSPDPNQGQEPSGSGGVEISTNVRRLRSVNQDIFVPEDLQSNKKTTKIGQKPNMNYINCDDGQFLCMEIRCIAKRKEQRHKTVEDEIFPMPFELYLVKNITDDLMVKSQKESILIESKGKVEIFSQDQSKMHYKTDSDVSQTLLSKLQGTVKLWVYAVAVLIALILMATITLILYKIGFFKREVHEKLLEAKADERRKSMMVPQGTARGSYNSFGTSQDDLLDDDNGENIVQQESQPLTQDKDETTENSEKLAEENTKE